MTDRAIILSREAVYDICDALNEQAYRFDDLANGTTHTVSSREIWKRKADANRALTARILAAWDAGKQEAA